MNVTFEKQGDVKGLITVEVVEADYADKVKKQLKNIGATHALPGFRKGHVPFSILEKKFGKDVTSEVINEVVYDATTGYIQENKLEVMGAPVPVDVVTLDLPAKKDYTFKYEVALAPQLDLKLDKDVTLPFYTITVTDEMVDEQDKNLRKRFGAQVPGEVTEPDALVKGAIMELNEDGTVKETEDAIQVINGIVAPMYFKSKEQAEKFADKKVGDKVVFNPAATCDSDPTELSSMLQIDKERAAGITADFEMAISEIIVVRPAELGEEFYKNVFGETRNITGEEEYRQAVSEMIAGQLIQNSTQLFQEQATTYLIDTYAPGIQLADDVLKKFLASSNRVPLEQIEKEYDSDILPGIKWQIIRNEAAEKLGVKVEEADMEEFAAIMARRQFAQYGMTNLSDDVYADYGKRMLADEKMRSRIAENVFAGKFFAAVKDAVNIEAKAVTIDEFRAVVEEANKAAEQAE